AAFFDHRPGAGAGADLEGPAADHRQVHAGLTVEHGRASLRILVTKDDGIFSEGIKLLAQALAPLGDVVVVAPDREQSASGHSLTLNRPLRLPKNEER